MAQVLQQGSEAVTLTFIILLTLLIILWLLLRRGAGDGDRYRGSPPPSTEPRAFTHGQFILHIDHRTERISAATINTLLATWLSGEKPAESFDIQEGKPTAITSDDRITTFRLSDATSKSFAVVLATVGEQDVDDAELFRLIAQINSVTFDPSGDVTRASAGPNWLMSPSNGKGSPTGGPGGLPRQVTSPFSAPNRIQHVDQPGQGQITITSMAEGGDGTGRGVNVAILDTLPCLHALAEAYKRDDQKRKTSGETSGHRLVKALLHPDSAKSRVWFHPAPSAALFDKSLYEVDCHNNYQMADHGLFVTGLIRDIVPEAKLHLIEVMNAHGVGSVDSLIHGLKVLEGLIRSTETEPWVINCSFFFTLPDCGHPDMVMYLPFDDGIKEKLAAYLQECKAGASTDIEDKVAMIDAFRQQVEALLKLIKQPDIEHRVCVVAAAGNDNRLDCKTPNQGLPGRKVARYPAAFEGIIGVAALNDDDTPAQYSNYADQQFDEGFSIFGGKVEDINAMTWAEVEHSVRGIYLGLFPDKRETDGSWIYKPNTTGWAWWAGTSFATPMISGLAATILTRQTFGTGSSTTRTVIDRLNTLVVSDGTDRKITIQQR